MLKVADRKNFAGPLKSGAFGFGEAGTTICEAEIFYATNIILARLSPGYTDT